MCKQKVKLDDVIYEWASYKRVARRRVQKRKKKKAQPQGFYDLNAKVATKKETPTQRLGFP